MIVKLMEFFKCPGCARRIARPDGSSTWCPCGADIPPSTAADKIVQMLEQENELLSMMRWV